MKRWKSAVILATLLAAGTLSVTAEMLQIGEEISTETVKTIDGGSFVADPRHNIPAAYVEGQGYALHAENAAFANGKFTAVLGGELSLSSGLINSPVSQINAKGGKISITDTAIRINGIWASDGGRVTVTGGAVSGGTQSLISASAGGLVEITDSGKISMGGLHADGIGSAVRISHAKEIAVEKILATDGGKIELTGGPVTVAGNVELSGGAVLSLKNVKLSIEGELTRDGGLLDIGEGSEVTVRGVRMATEIKTPVHVNETLAAQMENSEAAHGQTGNESMEVFSSPEASEGVPFSKK